MGQERRPHANVSRAVPWLQGPETEPHVCLTHPGPVARRGDEVRLGLPPPFHLTAGTMMALTPASFSVQVRTCGSPGPVASPRQSSVLVCLPVCISRALPSASLCGD